MKIKICDKCKTKEVIDELNSFNLEIGCINYCGIARSKYVAIIDDIPIIEDDKNTFLDKIKRNTSKN